MNKYSCGKCLHKIGVDKLIIRNNKLICPYCGHTLETDKFKVQLVKDKLEKKKEDNLYEDKSTDK